MSSSGWKERTFSAIHPSTSALSPKSAHTPSGPAAVTWTRMSGRPASRARGAAPSADIAASLATEPLGPAGILAGAMIAPEARFLAVVPAYNEASTLGAVLDELADHVPHFDIVVVDDGSTDETARVAREHGARVLRHPFNLGIGGAVQSGFRHALENDHDYMVQVDGDGQHDPAEIAKLKRGYEHDPTSNVVVGSRFLRGSAEAPDYPAPVSRRT